METEVEQVHKGKGIFNPEWLSEQGMKPFPLRHINAKKDHLQNLKYSIQTNGFNRKEPLIVAKSTRDPEANGMILDGRNRAVVCDQIRVETGTLPNIAITYETVKDVAHAKLRQIYYESQHLNRKDSEDALAHIIELYQEVKEEIPELGMQKNLDEVLGKEAGFGASDKTQLMAVCHKINLFQQKQLVKENERMKDPRKPGSFDPTTDWVDTSKTPEVIADSKPIKTFATEFETTCVCGKKTNYAINALLYESGKLKLEQVN